MSYIRRSQSRTADGIWRTICLRGAGFPATWLVRLGGASGAAIDHALATGAPLAPSLKEQFEADVIANSLAIRGYARDPRFREAILMQNPQALRTGIDSLLAQPDDKRNSSTREREQLVAKYLQRYCVKNDTIGFSGPVGWLGLDENLAGARFQTSDQLTATHTVYFEHWAIDALATELSKDLALRASLAPRLMPTVRLEGNRLHHSIDRVSELPAVASAILAACDGSRSARAVAEQLVGVEDLESADDVYAYLDDLAESRVVIWRLEIPTYGFTPERALRAALETVEDEDARTRALATLDTLCAARDRVHQSFGDVPARATALEALAETFETVTGQSSSRLAGKTYAGRSVVFEDCRRDIQGELGRVVADAIRAPFEMIRASGRWFTHRFALQFRGVFDRVYREEAEATGQREVSFVRVYAKVQPLLAPIAREVRAELHERWKRILAVPEGQRRVQLASRDLLPLALDVFGAPGPGWPSARHHSPDIMLASESLEAIGRGEFQVVLGEVHAGVNGVAVPTLLKEHPEPAAIARLLAEDLGSLVQRVEPRQSIQRGAYYSVSEDILDIEYGDARSHRPRERVAGVADFVVTSDGDRLRIARRDGSASFDPVMFLEGDLMAESYAFDMFETAAYRPRITVDNFVLARETWRFTPDQMPFASSKQMFDRFVGLRKLARAHGMPRFLFAKVTSQPKPVFLDLDSPTFVEIFCKLVRFEPTRITLSEMLPAFDQLWLPHPSGGRSTSELRMAIVDPVTWDEVSGGSGRGS